MNIIIDVAKKFLIEYLEGKSYNFESVHSWRNDAKFTILHSFRVHSYAVKIIENDYNHICDTDKLIIEFAAILHDIGKIESNENHAKYSANIVRQWLTDNPDISNKVKDTEKLITIIQTHSDKGTKDDELCSAILKDADTLDEIGALSIFMCSNRIDRSSPFFFNELLERTSTYEVDFCNKKMKILNSTYAKSLLKEKLAFIEKFNEQLALELEGTEEFYKLR